MSIDKAGNLMLTGTSDPAVCDYKTILKDNKR